MCLPRAEKGSTFAGKRRGVIYHVPPVSLCLFRGVGAIICFHVERRNVINPNRSLDRICLDLLLPSCFLPALVRLPASALSLHLDVARYAFDETSAHLLNNRTKSVKDSNDRFGFIKYRNNGLISGSGSLLYPPAWRISLSVPTNPSVGISAARCLSLRR